MKIYFLGTGGAIPTEKRWHPSIVVSWCGEYIMLDCGEGAVYRYLGMGLSINREMTILITHMHGDHFLGLFAMLQTFNMYGRTKPLTIVGPEGLSEILETMFKVSRTAPAYPVKLIEIKTQSRVKVLETDKYVIEASPTDHSIPCYAYAIVEKPLPGTFRTEKAKELGIPVKYWKLLQKGHSVVLDNGRVVKPEEVIDGWRRGIKIVYSGDTRPCRSVIELAKGADILIHDSTFSAKDSATAKESYHSTSVEAAQVAEEAGVNLLILFHISPRYSNEDELVEEARMFHKNTIVAKDKMVIELDHV